MEDLSELRFFLQTEFARSETRLVMNQRKYALEPISEVGVSGTKLARTPIDGNVKLISKQYDEQKGQNPDDKLVDQSKYQKLIGKLLYFNMIRSDISYAIQTLSQFLQRPKKNLPYILLLGLSNTTRVIQDKAYYCLIAQILK